MYQAAVVKQSPMHLDIYDGRTDIKPVCITTRYRCMFLFLPTVRVVLFCHELLKDGNVVNLCTA